MSYMSTGEIPKKLLEGELCEEFNTTNDDITLGCSVDLIFLACVKMFKIFHILLEYYVTFDYPLSFLSYLRG